MIREIVLKHPKQLREYERNARTHSAAQVDQIVASITKFGFCNPILIDENGTVIAGHGRLAAAVKMSLSEVPTITISHLTEEQRKAYILADNKIALNSDWNKELLTLELSSLKGLIDLELLGFGKKELLELLPVQAAGGNTDPDGVPNVHTDPVTKQGDLWLLGDHRLLCGDSVSLDHWQLLMGGEQMSWVWTDPPYNVNYGDKAAALNKVQKGHRNCDKIMNDNMSNDQFLAFLRSMFVAVHTCMEPGAAIYVAHAETERANFTVAFLQAGFKLSTNIIWKKNQLVLGRSDWQYIHEPILYGWKTGAAHHWVGGRKNVTVQEMGEAMGATRTESGNWLIQAGDDIIELAADAVVDIHPTTLLSVPKPQRNDAHPTMKPVALVERCLRFSAPPGSVGADAFGGSGTTMIAAERLGLRSRIMEMEPKYCDVIIKRWQNYTGRVAVHAVSGGPFPCQA